MLNLLFVQQKFKYFKKITRIISLLKQNNNQGIAIFYYDFPAFYCAISKPGNTASGITLVVPSSCGNEATDVTIDCKLVNIGLNAYIRK